MSDANDIDPDAITRELTDEYDAHLFEDGILVVSDGTHSDARTVRGVSGYGPVFQLTDHFGLSDDVEDDLINFVHDNTEFFSDDENGGDGL